jgi:hypothetical protein
MHHDLPEQPRGVPHAKRGNEARLFHLVPDVPQNRRAGQYHLYQFRLPPGAGFRQHLLQLGPHRIRAHPVPLGVFVHRIAPGQRGGEPGLRGRQSMEADQQGFGRFDLAIGVE